MSPAYINGVGDWVRVINGIGAVVILILLVWRCFRVWSKYSISQKMTYGAVTFYMIGLAWRSWQIIVSSDLPFSLGLACIFIGHTIMFAYLMEPSSRYKRRLGSDLREPKEKSER